MANQIDLTRDDEEVLTDYDDEVQYVSSIDYANMHIKELVKDKDAVIDSLKEELRKKNMDIASLEEKLEFFRMTLKQYIRDSWPTGQGNLMLSFIERM